MPVTSKTTDPDALTMTFVAEYPVSLRRLWDAYVDPRQVERHWTVPAFPVRFPRHDAFPGGRSVYRLNGPGGFSHVGYWEWIDVQPPSGDTARIEMLDGFGDDEGRPVEGMTPVRMVFDFEATADGARLTSTSYCATPEAFTQLVGMGIPENTAECMAQIDGVVADDTSFTHGRVTEADLLGDTQVRLTRVVGADVEQVWRAHQDAALMRQWMLGPDGWEMPVCEVAGGIGDHYRYEWAPEGGGDGGFGFTGELLESTAPHRMVTTEAMVGATDPATTNEMTLTPLGSGTLVSTVIVTPSAEVRDAMLATGMVDGVEASYARLEGLLT